MSKVELALLRHGPIERQVGKSHRRPAQRGQYTTLPIRWRGQALAHFGAKPIGVRALLCEPLGQGPKQRAIVLAANHLEARQPLLVEALAIVPESTLLGCFGYRIISTYSRKYSRAKSDLNGVPAQPASLRAAFLAALRSRFQNVRFVLRRCFHHSPAAVRMPFFTVAIPQPPGTVS